MNENPLAVVIVAFLVLLTSPAWITVMVRMLTYLVAFLLFPFFLWRILFNGRLSTRLYRYFMGTMPEWRTFDEVSADVGLGHAILYITLLRLKSDGVVESRVRESVPRERLSAAEAERLESIAQLSVPRKVFYLDIPVHEFRWTGKAKKSKAKASRKGLTLINERRVRRELGV